MKKIFIYLSMLLMIAIGIPTKSYAQSLDNGFNSIHYILKEANAYFYIPAGWRFVDNVLNESGEIRHFMVRFSPNFAIYNKEHDIYIFIVPSLTRSHFGAESDSLANHRYLDSTYLSYQRIHLTTNHVITDSMLNAIRADAAAAYKAKLDTPFLKKYRYVKVFSFHRQDIATFWLTCVAPAKSYDKAVDEAVKSTWGMIGFYPDSQFHPTESKNLLVGRFRHLRPYLHTKDTALAKERMKKMHFAMKMTSAKIEEKNKNYSSARGYYLSAHQLWPANSSPITRLFLMYLHQAKTDSAERYLDILRSEYLPNDPRLKVAIIAGKVQVLNQRGRYDSVIVMNKELLKLQPHHYQTNISIGDAYQHLNQYNQAIQWYKKAQEMAVKYSSNHQENAYTHYQLGKCYMKLSPPDKKEAEKYFIKAKKGGYELPWEIIKEFDL